MLPPDVIFEGQNAPNIISRPRLQSSQRSPDPLAGRGLQWWANPKSNAESPTPNLKSLDLKSQIWEDKSRISNREQPNQIESPSFKSQMFSKYPKTYLLPQKIRWTTMPLMSKSHIFDANLVFMWLMTTTLSKVNMALSVYKVEYAQTLNRQFRMRVHCGAAMTLQLL